MAQSPAISTRTAAGLALLALFVTGPLAAEDQLGRLFLTTEQRLALDAQRDAGARSPGDAMARQSPDNSATDRRVLLNGVVRRNHGPNVVWLNGQVATGNDHLSLRVRDVPAANNQVSVLKADGVKVRLKPGQVWDPATGQISECFGCRATISVPAAIPGAVATDP